MSNRLAVDFDNTLTTDNVAYWDDERPEPDDDVVEAVRQRYYAGDTVIVWTARPWSEAHQIAAHLTEWELPYHGVRCEKGSADTYVDDKAISPEQFLSE
jgi:hydroxymethylpyrimidine pyrophosphatase-like HAD family hydrolase